MTEDTRTRKGSQADGKDGKEIADRRWEGAQQKPGGEEGSGHLGRHSEAQRGVRKEATVGSGDREAGGIRKRGEGRPEKRAETETTQGK